MDSQSLPILLKLVNGDQETCFELIRIIREAHPGKSVEWCVQKAIYDIRFGKKQVKPNATLSRWGEGGGDFQATASPAAKPQPTPITPKPLPQLPPSPPPNPTLSTPKPKPVETVPSVLPDLAALARARRKQASSQPASVITKNRLDYLTRDRRVSNRLVSSILSNNPDRSEQWAYEKAIYELERDRV